MYDLFDTRFFFDHRFFETFSTIFRSSMLYEGRDCCYGYSKRTIRRTHQRSSEKCIVAMEKKERKKEKKNRFAIYCEKMNVEARQKDGKRSPVKRPGAPVSVDTALVEHNARPGRLSLTITVCYLVQLKHPLSLSSFFPQPLPLLRCFFVQRDAHGRARKVH